MRERSPRKNVRVQDLKTAVEQQLQRMLQTNRSQKRLDLYNRYQNIVINYNRETDRVAIEQTFEALLALVRDISEEDSRAVREGLDEDYLAIFDLLCEGKDNLDKEAIAKVKAVSRELLDLVRSRLAELEQWTEKVETQAKIRNIIRDELYELPEENYPDEEIEQYAKVIFLHISQQYRAARSRKD